MKKAALLILSVASLGGLAYPASAGSFARSGSGSMVFVGSISPRVTAVLDANRNNPQALAAAIKELLERDPSLAADVIELANTQTNPTTANAIATGYGQAVSALSGTNSQAAGVLRAQSVNFSAGLQAVYSAVATAAPPGGGNGNTGNGSTIVVPPSVSPR